jgi:anti-sigma regulatory factor (Ser/Thr protein kinase)
MVASLARELDRYGDAPGVARGCVRDLFRDLLEPDRTVAHLHGADVQMVVSELVTNAVLHGSGRIMLRVRVIDDIVSVGVRDANGEIPHLAGPSASAEGGRGMAVVDGLATDWGVRSDGVRGKEVWAILGGARKTDVGSGTATTA